MILRFLLLHILFFAGAAAAQGPFQFLYKIGFDNSKDRIIANHLKGDGTLIAVGTTSIRHWEIATGRLLLDVPHRFAGAEKWDAYFSFSPDGRRAILTDSFSFRLIRKEKKVTARVVDLENGSVLKVLERPTESVREAEWSPDGQILVTRSGPYNAKRTEVCFWDGETFELRICSLLKGSLGLARLIDNGRHYVYSRQTDTTCLLCPLIGETETAVVDTATGRIVHKLSVEGRSPYIWSTGRAIDAEGRYLAASLVEGRVAVWAPMRKGNPIQVIERVGKERYTEISGYGDGGNVLLLRRGKSIEARDLESGDVLFTLPLSFRSGRSGHMITVKSIGDRIVVDNCEEALVFAPPAEFPLFNLELVCKTEFDPVSTSYRDFDVLRFDETQRYLLLSSDKQIRIADGSTGKILQRIAAPERTKNIEKDPNKDDGLSGATWTRDGGYIVGHGADGRSFYIWKRVDT